MKTDANSRFYIVNDIDKPYEVHIAEKREDGKFYYIHPKHKDVESYLGMTPDNPTSLADFGISIAIIYGQFNGYQNDKTKAIYANGDRRPWKGSSIFNFKFENQQNKTMIKHDEMVKALAKSGEIIAAEINAEDAHLVHMAIGISGEAGELLDAIKKQVIYRKPLDRENVIEELGDLEFYMEGIRQGLGVTRDQCLSANIEKLRKRYEGLKYTDGAAQDRADKK